MSDPKVRYNVGVRPGSLSERRTHLANERTLLAYLRTAVGCFAAAVGVFGLLGSAVSRVWGWAFFAAGAAIALIGIVRFFQVRALIGRAAPETDEA